MEIEIEADGNGAWESREYRGAALLRLKLFSAILARG